MHAKVLFSIYDLPWSGIVLTRQGFRSRIRIQQTCRKFNTKPLTASYTHILAFGTFSRYKLTNTRLELDSKAETTKLRDFSEVEMEILKKKLPLQAVEVEPTFQTCFLFQDNETLTEVCLFLTSDTTNFLLYLS